MQLQTSSSRALLAALQLSAKCIPSKTVIAILDHVLLTRSDNGQFFFTSASSDSQLTIPAPLTLLGGKFAAPVALPVSGLVSYLSTLPECVVNLNLNDDKSLVLDYCTGSNDKVKAGKVKLTYESGEEFPKLDGAGENNTHIVLPTSVFMNAVEQSKNFVAQDELRPVMNALCIDIARDMSECYLVASDGHKLMKYIHTNNPKTRGTDFYRSGSPCAIMIHNQYFRSLAAFAGTESVEIKTDGQTISLISGDIEFICKAVEGKYPNYDSVIPKNNPFFICFDKKEILQVIKRVSIFGSDATKLIKLSKQGMFLNISAEDVDYSTRAEDQVIISDSQCNDGFAIGFNSQTLITAISGISTDDVRMELKDPSYACTIIEDNPASLALTLCMPMLL